VEEKMSRAGGQTYVEEKTGTPMYIGMPLRKQQHERQMTR